MNRQLDGSISSVLKSAVDLTIQRISFDDFLLSPYVSSLDIRDFKFLTHLCLLGGKATRETMKNSTSMDGTTLNNCLKRLFSEDLIRRDEDSKGFVFKINLENEEDYSRGVASKFDIEKTEEVLESELISAEDIE